MPESPRGIRNEKRFLFEQVREKTSDARVWWMEEARRGGPAIKKQ